MRQRKNKIKIERKRKNNKMRQPKDMWPPCTSMKCVNYKNRFCNTINLETRNSTFHKFWKDLEWGQKKMYVSSLMKKKTAMRFVQGDSRKSFTYKYFWDNEHNQVCKKMLLLTLVVPIIHHCFWDQKRFQKI